MEILWSPWRSKYIQTFKDEDKNQEQKNCFLCEAGNNTDKEKDKELLVVHRRKLSFIMLNKFPYNNGHILIAPYRHIGTLDLLTDEEIFDMMKAVQDSLKVIDEVMKPHGYNIGINIGRVAGAGLPDHIHFHIVPRWNGDTSFMAVLSDVKVVSQSLEETQENFEKVFKKLSE